MTAEKQRPEKADPSAKNRAWGKNGERVKFAYKIPPQALGPQQGIGPRVTETVSGRPRWLSRDPIGEEGGLNLYAMVGNDPVNQWDYLGLFIGGVRHLPGYTDGKPKSFPWSRVAHWTFPGDAHTYEEAADRNLEPNAGALLAQGSNFSCHVSSSSVGADYGDLWPDYSGESVGWASSVYFEILAGKNVGKGSSPSSSTRIAGFKAAERALEIPNRGHLLGEQFGGRAIQRNLVTQTEQFNQAGGRYRKMEEDFLKKYISEWGCLCAIIIPKYRLIKFSEKRRGRRPNGRRPLQIMIGGFGGGDSAAGSSMFDDEYWQAVPIEYKVILKGVGFSQYKEKTVKARLIGGKYQGKLVPLN